MTPTRLSRTRRCTNVVVLPNIGHEIIHHNGVTAGFGSFQFFLPGYKFGGVVIGNSIWATEVGTGLGMELVSHVVGVEGPEWPAWNDVVALLDEERAREAKELRESLCPDLDAPEKQSKPLREYVGRYRNDGYREMVVEIVGGELFVNATDRSDAFTLNFEHLCEQRKYVARLEDVYEKDSEEIAAEFEFDVEGISVRYMGLKLTDDVDGLIWFEKQDSAEWSDQRAAAATLSEQQVVGV